MKQYSVTKNDTMLRTIKRYNVTNDGIHALEEPGDICPREKRNRASKRPSENQPIHAPLGKPM